MFLRMVDTTYFPVYRGCGFKIVGDMVAIFVILPSSRSSLRPTYTSCWYCSLVRKVSLEDMKTPATTES